MAKLRDNRHYYYFCILVVIVKRSVGYMDKTVKKLFAAGQTLACSLKRDLDGELVVLQKNASCFKNTHT